MRVVEGAVAVHTAAEEVAAFPTAVEAEAGFPTAVGVAFPVVAGAALEASAGPPR
jgi:hypothetical protein